MKRFLRNKVDPVLLIDIFLGEVGQYLELINNQKTAKNTNASILVPPKLTHQRGWIYMLFH